MKTAALVFLVAATFLSGGAEAASSTTALINSNNELVINFVDKPHDPPLEAAMIWNSIIGADATKKVHGPGFSLICTTAVSSTLNQRFGHCKLVLGAGHFRHELGYYGAIFSDPGILSQMLSGNWLLAGGKIRLTVDHSQNAVGVIVDENLVEGN